MSVVQASEVWKNYNGGYNSETLKEPHVIPAIASLPYTVDDPVVIDVGGGYWSLARRVHLPFPRSFRVANIDFVLHERTDSDSSLELATDIDSLVQNEEQVAAEALRRFIAVNTQVPYVTGADLVLYSEVLAYVDFRRTMKWFDGYLKPGGFVLIVNKPGRGFASVFSEDGVKGNRELTDYLFSDLGYDELFTRYPWGQYDDDKDMLIIAGQKPLANS